MCTLIVPWRRCRVTVVGVARGSAASCACRGCRRREPLPAPRQAQPGGAALRVAAGVTPCESSIHGRSSGEGACVCARRAGLNCCQQKAWPAEPVCREQLVDNRPSLAPVPGQAAFLDPATRPRWARHARMDPPEQEPRGGEPKEAVEVSFCRACLPATSRQVKPRSLAYRCFRSRAPRFPARKSVRASLSGGGSVD